ncbi:MAG TPA: hypothetical protein VD816_03440 [Ohtaekwangia sp.]|nr:hypothetical protein [Ohtaekwangia sp.]
MQYREVLSHDEWHVLVDQTRTAITQYPDQFLGSNLPSKDITRAAIDLVFEGFLRDMHIRKVQSFRGRNTFGLAHRTL